jgi:hypothetical protein
MDKFRFKVIGKINLTKNNIKILQIFIRISATIMAQNQCIFASHLLCHAQGKREEKHATLNWWGCVQIWRMASFIFMPILNIIMY